jgi:hypothetical protein
MLLCLFEYELCNAVSNTDLKWNRSHVYQDYTHISAIVWIDDPPKYIDSVFESEAGAGGNTTVGSFGQRDSDPRFDELAALGPD